MLVNLASGTATGIDPELSHATEVTAAFLATELPRGVTRYLWGPPPGRLLTTHPLLYVDALAWILVSSLILAGFITAGSSIRRAILPLLEMPLVAAALGGLTLGSFGIISRIRAGTGIAMLPIAGVGLSVVFQRALQPRRKPHDLERPIVTCRSRILRQLLA